MAPARSNPPVLPTAFDRAADERTVDGLVDALRADAATRVLVLHGDAAPLGADDALQFFAPDDVADGGEWAFLGRGGDGTAVLTSVFARDAAAPVEPIGGWGALRAVGGGLAPGESALFVEALSLGRWLLDAPFCPACGAHTEQRQAGWARHCPSCGREHFPRTDPAVIVAVASAQQPSRLLLGSNAMWGANRFSCFAGFAEAGESLESTVAREVYEEAGVALRDIRYSGSQAWPYPRSLMLGFHAIAADDDAARPDGDEIVDVRWFTASQIGEALAGEGELLLPGPASISRRLIEEWHASAR
ncbi:NAD(+) diphosphatase [Microbacterium sp. P02]|uniref:NAD(+) diphosphatase n=1 Tax=Microbacterium sp. P02 TaxID=3366260 RepID=UPI00366D08A2